MGAQARKESMKIVPPGKKKCVWMEAGVVSYKLCDNNFDCSTCVYDQAMQVKVDRQKESLAAASQIEPAEDKFTRTWAEKMLQLPAGQRKCRYMLTGEVDRKICPNSYECGNCEFDQIMQERLQTEALPVGARSDAAGFELAEDFYYHEGHTWARPEYGGRVRVGLDDFARKLLGKLSRIELPAIGQEISQGRAGIRVRRNGDTARVLSPLDGIVARINHELAENPDIARDSTYEKGWLFIVEPTKLRKNLKNLYFGEDAKKFTIQEKDKLLAMANEDLRIAADGGPSVDDIAGQLDGKNWAKFVQTFLRT